MNYLKNTSVSELAKHRKGPIQARLRTMLAIPQGIAFESMNIVIKSELQQKQLHIN